MKIYCQKCGSGTSYNMQKPKFCQNCGYSFSGEVKATSKPKVKLQKTELISTEEEDEDISVPQNINKLEFDTVGTLQVKGTTVANLAGTISPDEINQPVRGDSPQINNENFLEQFKKEAGTSRPRK